MKPSEVNFSYESDNANMDTIYDVIIIGSGPAGLTAALYTTRAALKTLVIAGVKWGGQLMLTTLVENYPGFADGIMGPELMTAMRKQAEHHGAEVINTNFKSADFTSSPAEAGSLHASGQAGLAKPLEITTEDGKVYKSKTIIIATGADTKWLDVPGEKEKIGRGVASCAPCDAAFYKGKRVIVVGGGDSAMEEASVLTKFAQHVWVVHRRDSLKASDIMQKRSFENPKITFIWNSGITEVMGEGKVEQVLLKSNIKNQIAKIQIKDQNEDKEITPEELGGKSLETKDQQLSWQFPIDGIFVAIGHLPNSTLFKGIETDEKGFIKIHDHTKTNLDRVYVAGDVHDNEYKQAVTAAGFGCMAALEVEKYLRVQSETS